MGIKNIDLLINTGEKITPQVLRLKRNISKLPKPTSSDKTKPDVSDSNK